MEDNFRNTLIIISAVIIGAIFVHGLWTIRKNKNPYKLKTSKEPITPLKNSVDNNGFDQDGIGKVTVKTKSDYGSQNSTDNSDSNYTTEQSSPRSFETTEPTMSSDGFNLMTETEHKSDRTDTHNNEVNMGSMEIPSFDAFEKKFEEVSSQENTDNNSKIEHHITNVDEEDTTAKQNKQRVKLQEVETAKPIYQQPVSRPKKTVVSPSKAELKRNQIELNFDNEKKAKADTELEEVKPEVLSISVIMPQNQIMQGAVLLPTLLTLGLKYGEMNVFHRHQDNAGTGPVTFSVANVINPGSFDLDTMETFVTPGITLFMMLPNAGNAFDVFHQMLSAAKQLSEEFQAQIIDDKRNVMTKQTEQHYVSRIRDFEIKNRLAAV